MMKAQFNDTNAATESSGSPMRFAATPLRIGYGSRPDETQRAAGGGDLLAVSEEQAARFLEATPEIAPTEIEDRLKLGVARYVRGDDASAIWLFNDVINEDASHADAWFNLGMVIFGQGQFAEAEYCFCRACEIEPADPEAWNNRGVCLWRLEQHNESRRCIQRALEIDAAAASARGALQHLA